MLKTIRCTVNGKARELSFDVRASLLEVLRATLAAISAAVEADVQPRTSWRANRDFRMHIIRTLAERVIARCVVRAVELQEAASC